MSSYLSKGIIMDLDPEFEAPSPHEEHVEHETHHADKGSLTSKIALLTAILSTVGALFSYNAGHELSEAMLYKSEAGIKRTQANDQWNFYQSKNIKEGFQEMIISNPAISDDEKKKAQNKIKHYEDDKKQIQDKANAFEEEATKLDEKSETTLHTHHDWAQAMTAIQIAISLAAITILTKKKWLFVASIGVSAVGVIYGLLALFG